MEVYESELIEGLLFTTERSQKEFDRLLMSKEDINNFMIDYNLSLIKDYGYDKSEHFCVVYKNGKFVVKVKTPERLKKEDKVVLKVGIDELEFYFSEVEGSIIDNWFSFVNDTLSILNSNIDENFIINEVRKELKSKLVIE